jgi:hypothetical protein
MSNPELHRKSIFVSGRLIPAFAKMPVETGCECQNRTTGPDLPRFGLKNPHIAGKEQP